MAEDNVLQINLSVFVMYCKGRVLHAGTKSTKLPPGIPNSADKFVDLSTRVMYGSEPFVIG